MQTKSQFVFLFISACFTWAYTVCGQTENGFLIDATAPARIFSDYDDLMHNHQAPTKKKLHDKRFLYKLLGLKNLFGTLTWKLQENDICHNKLCAGNRICQIERDKAVCICKGKYTGDNCENSPCDGVSCSGAGNCSVVNDQPFCRCKGNYAGDMCEISLCDGVSCSGKGNCSVVNDQPACRCRGKYSGDRCEVSPCDGLSCSGVGNCSVVNDQPICRCDLGYEGPNCEKDLCSSFPCKNDGNCTMGNGSYQCSCKVDHTGINCETDLKCKTCLRKTSELSIKTGTSCTEYFADGFLYPCPRSLVFDASMCGCVIQPLAASCTC